MAPEPTRKKHDKMMNRYEEGKIICNNFLSSLLLCLIKLGVDNKNEFNRVSYFPKTFGQTCKNEGWLVEKGIEEW